MNFGLYLLTFSTALVMSLLLTPSARAAAIVLKIFDHPITQVKTHKEPVPYLGGIAIYASFIMTLFFIRILTSFPTGTLRSLRGIMIGGTLMFIMGLVDDVKSDGLRYQLKFLFQFSAALMLILFGIQIKFIQPNWISLFLTVLWIVGITNSLNILDIMDGLSSGIGVIACLFFLFISLPTEEIYVNFTAAALAGACLGFFPYNTSKSLRIFMGDCGSLFIGFILSSISLGTSYGDVTEWGVLAPLLILAIPIYDTSLVFTLRALRGTSPFLGSKDHFALRLEAMGWKRPQILIFILCAAFLSGLLATLLTHANTHYAILIFSIFFISIGVFTKFILKVKISK